MHTLGYLEKDNCVTFKAQLCCFLLNVNVVFNEYQWFVIGITPARVVKSINI